VKLTKIRENIIRLNRNPLLQHAGVTLTNRCQINCAHCYLGKKNDKDAKKEVFDTFFGYFNDIGILHLLGAESTLAKQETTDNFAATIVDNNVKLSQLSFVTNGISYPKEFFARLKDLYQYMKSTARSSAYNYAADLALVSMLVSGDYFHNAELQRLGLTPKERDNNINEIKRDNPWLKVNPEWTNDDNLCLKPIGNAKNLYNDYLKSQRAKKQGKEIPEIFKHCEFTYSEELKEIREKGLIYDTVRHTLKDVNLTDRGNLLNAAQPLDDSRAFGNILNEPITDILERNEYR
jgi:hypothetical protein